MAGFPPKEVAAENSQTLEALGIKNGEALAVKRGAAKAEMREGKSDGGPVVFSIGKEGAFRVHSIPADNSCLFHCAAFLFKKQASGAEAMQEMRNLVAAEARPFVLLLCFVPLFIRSFVFV